MEAHRFSASAVIEAPPGDVYEVIADYQHGHPRILPRPPFVSLAVEEGGRGAGTVIRVEVRVLGVTQTYRAAITEPEPGRSLVESNDTGHVTTFTVEPLADGRHSRVTIATEMPRRGGPAGALERWFIPRLMRPVFVEELGLLAGVAVRRKDRDGPLVDA